MASDAAEGEEGLEGEAQPKKGKKKLILIIALPILLLIGVGAGVFFSGILSPPPPPATDDTGEQGKPAPPPPSQQVIFKDLPDLVVNLTNSQRKSTFLKISVSLELESQRDEERINQLLPQIIDNFQVYLRELRFEDLQGSAGVYRLREELLRRVNFAVRPTRVRDVLFKEILVQ